MRFGIVGLGRMGANIARHALERGHAVVGSNVDPARTDALAGEGFEPAYTMEELAEKLNPVRVGVAYVPHGAATLSVLEQLRELFEAGDIVVDGGNSMSSQALEQAVEFRRKGIRFLDVGRAGAWPADRHGAGFRVGGDRSAFEHVRPLLADLAVEDAARVPHIGAAGAATS